MPRGAYLRRPAPTALSLVHQVTTDPIVRRRYERAWSLPAESVLAKFRGVRLSRMTQPKVMKVYYFRPATGIWGYRLRRVNKGCAIFRHPDGSPFLVQVCGNPLQPAPSHPQNLPQSVATTVKDFDPQESLSADLVMETPTISGSPDSSIAPVEPSLPQNNSFVGSGNTPVTSNGRSVAGGISSSGSGFVSGGGIRGDGPVFSSSSSVPSPHPANGTAPSMIGNGSSTAFGQHTAQVQESSAVSDNTLLSASKNRNRTEPTISPSDLMPSSDAKGNSLSGSGDRSESLSSPEPNLLLLLPLFLVLAFAPSQSKQYTLIARKEREE